MFYLVTILLFNEPLFDCLTYKYICNISIYTHILVGECIYNVWMVLVEHFYTHVPFCFP